MARLGRQAHGLLGNDRAAFDDLFIKRRIFRRIDDIDAAGHDGDGAAIQGPGMGHGVDAARHARSDDDPLAADTRRQGLGHAPAVGRSVTRADDGDGSPAEEMTVAPHAQGRRRIVEHRQHLRVVLLAPGDQPGADLPQGLDLARRGGGRTDLDRPCPPAAARQFR